MKLSKFCLVLLLFVTAVSAVAPNGVISGQFPIRIGGSNYSHPVSELNVTLEVVLVQTQQKTTLASFNIRDWRTISQITCQTPPSESGIIYNFSCIYNWNTSTVLDGEYSIESTTRYSQPALPNFSGMIHVAAVYEINNTYPPHVVAVQMNYVYSSEGVQSIVSVQNTSQPTTTTSTALVENSSQSSASVSVTLVENTSISTSAPVFPQGIEINNASEPLIENNQTASAEPFDSINNAEQIVELNARLNALENEQNRLSNLLDRIIIFFRAIFPFWR